MNHEPSASFVLTAQDDQPPPLLERVDVDGRVDGILLTTTLRQTWRHTGPRPLEVVYTFPLPPQALLLSFAAVRGDARIEGTIAPRAEAEAVYEEALERGDAPALLEVGSGGLHTASLGNLMPGETVVLEVSFTQLLRFEHGRLRLVVPTTIAPRYGQPSSGGLAPHQAPLASLTAEYPLALGITIVGSLASAHVDCPTHRHRIARSEGTTRVDLEPGARMDRDVVIVLQPSEPRPALLVTTRDPLARNRRHVALAAFELPRRPSNRPLSLKLLVDCSGSMSGDGIASARIALEAIAGRLGADDEVAMVRFGDGAQIALPAARCTAATLQALRQQIRETEANLGGTEMASALRGVLKLPHTLEQSDVLLITDGQVWEAQSVAEAARRTGQRIFAIGVGSAAVEGVLRDIVAATGGACDFATPGEDLQAAALRMLERMRDTPCRELSVDWGRAAPSATWQQPLPAAAFGGDTVVALAVFDGAEPDRAALTHDGSPELIRANASEAVDAEVLSRLIADHERRQQANPEARDTAVRYRLLTEHTHCVLVHARADQDRPTEPANLVRVPQMLAAGWGGTGTLVASNRVQSCLESRAFFDRSALDFDSPVLFSRSSRGPADVQYSLAPSEHTWDDASELADAMPPGRWKDALLGTTSGQALPPDVAEVLVQLQALGLDEVTAWVVMAHAVLKVQPGSVSLPDWAQERFQHIEESIRVRAMRIAEDAVGPAGSGSTLLTRAQRLLGALRR